jgi:hypothetical protein
VLESLPIPLDDPIAAEEVVSFRYLGGTIIWLDIISSITAGKAPHLISHHHSFIASNPLVELETLMGCQNWVMLQIGRIAALYAQRVEDLQLGHAQTCAEYAILAYDISRELQRGLTEIALSKFNISGHEPAVRDDTLSAQPAIITQIFAHAAVLYLHLVTLGFEKLEILDTTLSTVLELFNTQISSQVLPSLVFPLFIIGSVATHKDEHYLRGMLSSLHMQNTVYKYRERIMSTLEEIWRRRQTTPGFAWKDCLELANNTLLL